MTIDKRKEITIPTWMFSGLVSLLIAVITTWGVVSSKTATTEVRLNHVEVALKNKVEKDEFEMVVDELREIKRILMKDRK